MAGARNKAKSGAGLLRMFAFPVQVCAVLGLLAPPVHGAPNLGFPWVVICGAQGVFLYNMDTGERREHNAPYADDMACHTFCFRRTKASLAT